MFEPWHLKFREINSEKLTKRLIKYKLIYEFNNFKHTKKKKNAIHPSRFFFSSQSYLRIF
jgi:hypothetical protein